MTIRKALPPRDDVDRLCVSRKKGRRGLPALKTVDASIIRLENYIEKQEGGLIIATKNNTDNASAKNNNN